MRIYFFLALTLISFQTVSGQEQGEPASTNAIIVQDFVLSNQYKKEMPQSFPKETVSIFALADRKGSDQLENWITPFYKRYEDRVDICGLANMKGLPKLLRPMLRGIFKKSIDYPVMMDWKGTVCESLHYKSGVADIFVVDCNGVVVHRISGEATEEKLQTCYAVIDRLMKESEAEAAEEENAQSQGKDPQASESTSDAPTQES